MSDKVTTEPKEKVFFVLPEEREEGPPKGYLSMVVGTYLILVLVRGFIALHYWKWFIKPTFGLETPSLPVCMGCVILVGVLMPPWRERPRFEDPVENLIVNAIGLSFLFVVGWLLSLLV